LEGPSSSVSDQTTQKKEEIETSEITKTNNVKFSQLPTKRMDKHNQMPCQLSNYKNLNSVNQDGRTKDQSTRMEEAQKFTIIFSTVCRVSASRSDSLLFSGSTF
jgi:hypothetical protein